MSVHRPTRDDLVREFRSELDAGESAAIAIAVERDPDLLLVDERDGRRIARRHGVEVTGVVGILLRAARDDDLEIESALDSLRDVGFWIDDDLYRRAVDTVDGDS